MLGSYGSDRLSTRPLDKVGWLLIGQFHLRGKRYEIRCFVLSFDKSGEWKGSSFRAKGG